MRYILIINFLLFCILKCQKKNLQRLSMSLKSSQTSNGVHLKLLFYIFIASLSCPKLDNGCIVDG